MGMTVGHQRMEMVNPVTPTPATSEATEAKPPGSPSSPTANPNAREAKKAKYTTRSSAIFFIGVLAHGRLGAQRATTDRKSDLLERATHPYDCAGTKLRDTQALPGMPRARGDGGERGQEARA